MDNLNLYQDIQARTNGDIYIGVVGPVRTGKSTFITKLLNLNITENRLRLLISKNSQPKTQDERVVANIKKILESTKHF